MRNLIFAKHCEAKRDKNEFHLENRINYANPSLGLKSQAFAKHCETSNRETQQK